MKKFIIGLLIACMLLSACSQKSQESKSEESAESSSSSQSEESSQEEEQVAEVLPPKRVTPTATWEVGYLPQAETPAEDAPKVTLHTTKGDIKMVLYPEAAPLTVENFMTHCKNGYYDNLIFHRVIKDFMIQGGDPDGNGTGGESIWGVPFNDEPSRNLYNFRGAVSMANAGAHTNGSQFFIVQQGAQTPSVTSENAAQYMGQMLFNEISTGAYNSLYEYKYFSEPTEEEFKARAEQLSKEANERIAKGVTNDEIKAYMPAMEHYMKVGGTPHLDFKHTVFGQVIDGMDVVDEIAAVKTEEGDRPSENIVITSVTVENMPDFEALKAEGSKAETSEESSDETSSEEVASK